MFYINGVIYTIFMEFEMHFPMFKEDTLECIGKAMLTFLYNVDGHSYHFSLTTFASLIFVCVARYRKSSCGSVAQVPQGGGTCAIMMS